MTIAAFQERCSPEIAAAMIELGSGMPGLPSYLGIELVAFGPGTIIARANMTNRSVVVRGELHCGGRIAWPPRTRSRSWRRGAPDLGQPGG